MEIPSASQSPLFKGEFIVVIMGHPVSNKEKKYRMFDRHLIKITSCSSGVFDVSALRGL